MKYFKNENNEVFAYDDEQVEKGYAKDLTAITETQMQELTKHIPTQEELIAQKYNEISLLETQLIRPMRELLSTVTSEDDKTYAQTKINDIETQIKGLRNEIEALNNS